MVKPPMSLPSFSHFAKVFSPFLQRAMCSFTGSPKKLEEQEEEALPQKADTGFPFFSSLLFSPYIPSLVLYPSFFFFLNLFVFAGVDTSVKGPKFVVLEVVVKSALNIQVAKSQTRTPKPSRELKAP